MAEKHAFSALRPALGAALIAMVALVAPALHATELSCEQRDNSEGSCCCFQKTHTYLFEAVPVSRLEVTFDTGRGIGCKSQVTLQLLRRDGWQTLRTVDATSSNGRSQVNRLSGTFVLGDTIGGVRIGDGGRCYIDYSKIVLDGAGDTATSDSSSGDPATGPATTPGDPRWPGTEPMALASGTYHLEAYSNRRHKSVWRLENDGGKITGTSEWDCCPGRRTDPLEGSARDGQVRIARSCTGQGLSGRCLQVYEGEISADGSAAGSWSQNGQFAGKWRLQPAFSTRPPERPASRIVADPAPPYREIPITIDFALDSGPVSGAVWWLDGRRMTNAEIFFWTFGEAGTHKIELRDRADQPLARHEVRVGQAGVTDRLWGRRRRSPGFDGVRNDLRELELERSATITGVHGSAGSYCIWTVAEGGELDHEVICGKEDEPITGAILLPGRYVVFPALADDQRETEVTIQLRPR